MTAMASVVGNSFSKGKQLTQGEQVEALGKALEKLFENANEEELVDLIVEVVEQCSKDGTRLAGKFDEEFSGAALKDSYVVFLNVVKGNYSDFLAGLGQE